ncbi:MAG TPA: dihydrodipicolinate synthase family protein [Burkholderiales bacterium]|nr:dihydrodipicolinate synthase family protein [Burkholderiales bacterium]
MGTLQAYAGIYPMLYAFFGRDGGLDRAAMRRQAQACIQAGAHGIAVLGLATEATKLSGGEKRALVQWVIDDAAGQVPIAVTVSEQSVQTQIEFANWAADLGACWAILQPPAERGRPEAWYADFFAQVMKRVRIPCAIQNAPDYIGVGLAPETICRLKDRCDNFLLLKAEGPLLAIRHLIDMLDGRLSVFNGRGGLELPDNLRAGCAGMIPSTDTVDYQVRIFQAIRGGSSADDSQAEAVYQRVLPSIVFALQSLDTLLCYGKRIAAMRLGLDEVYDRAPAMMPTAFGMACARRYADQLGPLA